MKPWRIDAAHKLCRQLKGSSATGDDGWMLIANALEEARVKGQREGLKMAAGIAEHTGATSKAVDPVCAKLIAAEIRASGGEKDRLGGKYISPDDARFMREMNKRLPLKPLGPCLDDNGNEIQPPDDDSGEKDGEVPEIKRNHRNRDECSYCGSVGPRVESEKEGTVPCCGCGKPMIDRGAEKQWCSAKCAEKDSGEKEGEDG